ncbi:MAG: hypothetical protein K2L95_03615 [Alphaproteobacteria bacterium]|nr:hypothetical protein [Alphaproteobacteria bacterium]
MKNFVCIMTACLMTVPAFALTPAGQGRRTMAAQMAPAPRATASTNQLSMMATTTSAATVDKSSVRVEPDIPKPTPQPEEPKPDTREKEKAACLNNNIGIGNTFVWASRYSNTGNYASMVEDTENPENNVCFVKVELKSDDAKVSVADIQPVYFEMGRTITCGDWADESKLKQRILDAKKTARTWGTVAGAVGGAGVGVGAMELFGNRLIGGKVEGQKDLERHDPLGLLRSQLAVLKKESPAKYNDFMDQLGIIKRECQGTDWDTANTEKPTECTKWEYAFDLV